MIGTSLSPKPHQLSGAAWLSKRRHALLADEMRVGKTLTALHAAKLVGARRILIVCPAVARRVWAVAVSDVFGRPATVVTSGGELLGIQKQFGSCIVVTSYGLVPDIESAPWDLVIMDESHFLRSGVARRTKQVYGRGGLVHRSWYVWALSGTPAVNHVAELWPMLRAFGVYAGAYETFVREFCISFLGPYGLVITGSKNQEKLRELMAPVMLRRTLAEVAPDLAPIEYSDYPLDGAALALPPIEVARAAAALNAADPTGALADAEPALATLRRLVGLSKAPLAVELLRDELEAGTHKVVVFAVHREVVGLLAEGLSHFDPVTVNGASSPTTRDYAVRKFQTDPGCRICIGNIQAAGTAIDLSVASECVFVESSWTPSDNAQAAARLQNMARTGTVTARFLSAGGTIDERIQRVVARKAADLALLFDKQV